MKVKFIAVFLVLAFACSSVYAQTSLTGIVRLGGQPVKRGVNVYTSFATTTTDDFGRYVLPLSGCPSCKPGARFSIYTLDADIGSSEIPCVISNDYKFDFSVVRNSRMFIYGMVQNSLTGDGLPNIEVKIMADIDMNPVTTNSFGQFTMPVRFDQMSNQNMNAVLLMARDPARRWKTLRSDPELFQINSFIKIRMEPSQSVSIKVSGLSSTRICFHEGDVITIEASGQITVGAFVGNSGPDGRESGVGSFSLAGYNIVSEFNHAALLYRISGDRGWRLAGKRKKFIAGRDGCLEFEINDNRQGDNYGAYEVEVTIQAG
jgi:hypothetical protein